LSKEVEADLFLHGDDIVADMDEQSEMLQEEIVKVLSE
jgi:hypothetical protein